MGSDGHLFLGACASIAACAMILPGISGSFILLLLGAYGAVIGALKDFDVLRIGAIAGGAILGLLGFSKLLQKLLKKARAQTLALLTGFLLGSLQALWPWKKALSSATTRTPTGGKRGLKPMRGRPLNPRTSCFLALPLLFWVCWW